MTTDKKRQAMEQRDELELRRSKVRVYVTYIAAGFIFVGGGAFIAVLLFLKEIDSAKDIFMAILPLATSVVTYWFATRQHRQEADSSTGQRDANENT